MTLIILYALLIIQSAFLILIGLKILAINKTPNDIPKQHLFKPKETPETEEEKKLRVLSENIENYDGTGKGQQKL